MKVTISEHEIKEAIKEWFEARRPDKVLNGRIDLNLNNSFGYYNFQATAEVSERVIITAAQPPQISDHQYGETNTRFKVNEDV